MSGSNGSFELAQGYLVAPEASKAGDFGRRKVPAVATEASRSPVPNIHLKTNSMFLQVLKELHGGFRSWRLFATSFQTWRPISVHTFRVVPMRSP